MLQRPVSFSDEAVCEHHSKWPTWYHETSHACRNTASGVIFSKAVSLSLDEKGYILVKVLLFPRNHHFPALGGNASLKLQGQKIKLNYRGRTVLELLHCIILPPCSHKVFKGFILSLARGLPSNNSSVLY